MKQRVSDVKVVEIMPTLYEGWLLLPFEECVESERVDFVRLKQNEILLEGQYPVIDQGESFINGYVNDVKLLYNGDLPVIIFGDHTRRLKFIDFTFAVGADGTKVLRPRRFLEPRFFYYYLQSLNIPPKGYSRHYKYLKEIVVPLPPLAEQARIVAVLDELMERIRSAREQLSELGRMPNRILRSFITDEDNELWPNVKLGGYCGESREKIKADWSGKRLIGVSKEDGITDLRIGTKASFENYKIVQPGDFLYNPMRVDIGSIAIYEGNEVAITSPDYVVFKVVHTLSPLLLLTFLKSELGLAEINNNTQGSVRSRLYFDNLCNINFPLGEVSDQQQAQKVLEVFNEIDKQRKAIEKKLALIEQGFLTKAFTGELTEQDPNDESASVLLKRIRIEREAEQQNSKPRKPRITNNITSKIRKSMAEQLRAIKDILAAAQTPVPTHTVWQQSVHKYDIEAFYAELKQLVDEEQSVVDIKKGDQSYLTLADAH